MVDKDQKPVQDATVLLVEEKKQTKVNAEGVFIFRDLAEGEYTLQVESNFFGNLLKTVHVTGNHRITLVFDIAFHEEFTVTAAPDRKSISDVAQAMSVLNQQDLQEKMAPTIGETLAREPGVSSTYFGPGASRPIIRGMGGERIRILEGGIGTGDVSSVSVDHAISAEAMTTERIEILRGPASLRYGSSAVGGVVNIIDNRISEFLSDQPLTGAIELLADTAAAERSGSAMLNGSYKKMAWHADLAARNTDDLSIPGFAERFPDQGETPGVLENSGMESLKGSAGLSFVGARGFFGFSVTSIDNFYGVPGHSEEDEGQASTGHGAEETVSIDLKQKRYDIRASHRIGGARINSLNVRLAATDYQHFELEGDEIGTRFFNDYVEMRSELNHNRLAGLTSGSIGVQYSNRDFEAIGEEAFVPPNQTEKLAVFVYEEIERDHFIISFGGRFENQRTDGVFLGHEADGQAEGLRVNRSISGRSGSLGVVLGKETDYGFAVNATRTERAPTPEELLSNGPHLATNAFEVGDPDLKKETSTGLDLQLRKKHGRLTGEVNLFYNRFDDYIYEQFTGQVEDGLQEFIFLQDDASFRGGEIHLDGALIHSDPHHLHLELTYDTVRAELENGGYLPRITPNRLALGLRYRQPTFWAHTEARFTDNQNRVAAFETTTDSHVFWNASAGYRFFVGGAIHQILLRGNNLTDEEGRNHGSFLKDRAPLPGRNLILSYNLSF